MSARNLIAVVNIYAFAAAPAATSADVGYRAYVDWLGWARLRPGERAGLASSYDRSGGNQDYSHYEWPEGLIDQELTATVKTISGPGLIYRFWMPHATANSAFVVRMFFDGEAAPRIDTTSNVIFAEGFSYFTAPLVDTCAGGQVCYEPIPFAHSLRIETVNQAPLVWNRLHYYQYSYVTLPQGAPLTSYTGALTPEDQTARDMVAGLFTNVGEHPAGVSAGAVSVPTPPSSIPAGGDLTLIDLAGPGIVRRLNLLMNAATDDELNALRLVVTYDAELTPAIDVPVAHFFGVGSQRVTYKSLPIGTDSPDGFYCYWPMPFRQAMLIRLHNPSTTAISIDSALVEYDPVSVGPSMCYLRVHAFTDYRSSGQTYHPMLTVTGRGHYVGNFLFVEDQPFYMFRMLEGDEIITVDGSDVLYGTGTEDAYNGGFYYNWVGITPGEPEGPQPQSATRPLSGLLYAHRQDNPDYARADQYRWYIADRIPFCDSIEIKIENQYAQVGSEWTSVAFWYEQLVPEVAGDLDNTGVVDAADLTMFVDVLLGLDGEVDRVIASDLNGDCSVNGLDIQGFSDAMLSR